MTLLGWCF